MKKILIGTSALVAAVSIVGAAQAAEPIKLSVGGFASVGVVNASQDDKYLTATGTEVTSTDVKGDNELHFKGSTTLDNGLTVSVKYEVEAGGRDLASSVDEYNITVGSAYGTVIAGSDDNALELIGKGEANLGGRMLNAPTGTIARGDLLTGNAVLMPTGTRILNSTAITTNGDAESISYVSPAFYGFTFGASYVADASQDQNPAQPTATTAGLLQGSNEAYGVGLMYNGTFSGVGVGLEGGYLWADAGNGSSTTSATIRDDQEWQIGGDLSYAGFGVGAAYRHQAIALAASDDMEARSWTAYTSYKTGPYGVSLAYFDSKAENTAANTSDDTAKVWELAGAYTMGPGVALVGGVGFVDFQNGEAAGTSSRANGNHGVVSTLGMSLTF